MVTSVFRPEVEIWPFRACAVKNTQYNLLYITGTVRLSWTCYWTDTTFHRTYFWLVSYFSSKNFLLQIATAFSAGRRLNTPKQPHVISYWRLHSSCTCFSFGDN